MRVSVRPDQIQSAFEAVKDDPVRYHGEYAFLQTVVADGAGAG